MIERIWSGRSPLWILLWPFSLLYGAITALIRFSYRRGWRKSWRAPLPVVGVGNLTAGGNGKTPVVIWLVEALQQRGVRAGVVSRGYGGKADQYPLLVTAQTSTEQAGDEPVLIAQRTAGPMRERASRLRQVDAVIINGGDAQPDEIAMQLQPGLATNLLTGETCPAEQLGAVVAMAGIGHPPRFFTTLKKQGITPVAEIAFADHHAYSEDELTRLLQTGQQLLMTEKDAVKCRDFAQPDWWYLPVDAHLTGKSVTPLLADIEQLCRRTL